MRIAFGVVMILVLLISANVSAGLALTPVKDKVALVIGNDAYSGSPLVSSVNDAEAIGSSLKRLGFFVTELHDVGSLEMKQKIADFISALQDGATGLIYFSGFGISVDGAHYLLPADVNTGSMTGLLDDAVNLTDVVMAMRHSGSGSKYVVIDTCRENPSMRANRQEQSGTIKGFGLVPQDEDGTVVVETKGEDLGGPAERARGLRRVQMGGRPSDILVLYSTEPGGIAMTTGSDSARSLFTSELLSVWETPDVSLDEMLVELRHRVEFASGGRQSPWWEGNMLENHGFGKAIRR